MEKNVEIYWYGQGEWCNIKILNYLEDFNVLVENFGNWHTILVWPLLKHCKHFIEYLRSLDFLDGSEKVES